MHKRIKFEGELEVFDYKLTDNGVAMLAMTPDGTTFFLPPGSVTELPDPVPVGAVIRHRNPERGGFVWIKTREKWVALDLDDGTVSESVLDDDDYRGHKSAGEDATYKAL